MDGTPPISTELVLCSASGSSIVASGAGRVVADSAAALVDAALITAAMARLAVAVKSAAGWPAGERRAVLAATDLAIDGLGAVRAGVLVAERDSGDWQDRGDRNFEAWRGRTSKVGQRAATVQVRDAGELDTVPDVCTAVTEGLIGLEHAKVIAKIAATGSDAQREAVRSAQGQADLVDLATRVDAGTFKTSAERWAGQVDPSALERDHQAQRAARFLRLTETRNGTHIKGLLDSVTGRKVAQALEAVTPKPSPADDREPEQRRADALGILAEHVLTDPDTKPGAHVPPQITFIVTEESFHGAQAERDRQRAARTDTAVPASTADNAAADNDNDNDGDDGDGDSGLDLPSVPTTVVGYEPATWEDGTPVPASEVGVAMCECELTRVVIDAAGAPVDLGRTQRLFTGVQRRAVIARDRECVWPDCHGPARWCHVHHLDWWDRDLGHTSVNRGALLCTHHHVEVHRLDLTLTRHTLTRQTLTDPSTSSGTKNGPGSNEPGSKAARGDGRVRPRATMARVWYQFREPSGRTFGHPPTTGPHANSQQPTASASPPPGSGNGTSSDSGSGTGSGSGAGSTRPAAGPPDDLDLTRVINPITGASQPAFWLT